MIEHIPITEVFPLPTGPQSITPWICGFTNATVHGPLGTITLDDVVVGDTLPSPDSSPEHFTRDADGIRLIGTGRRLELRNTTLSLLADGPENYYHWTLDCLGRLATAGPGVQDSCQYVLVPRLRQAFQRDGLALARLNGSEIIEVEVGDHLAVERLLVPWRPMEDHRPHPSLPQFFRTLGDAAACGPGPWPRRIYVDRSGGTIRPLVNEPEIIAALAPLGCVPVRLEAHPLAEQIAMFRQAECIVGPHGAGLANIAFASPGCRFVELHMDSYVQWCFRALAAACRLPYDCAIGRQIASDRSVLPSIHQQSWMISPLHVRAAVENILKHA
jgi:capsular polysaccharide biosynthesis protein